MQGWQSYKLCQKENEEAVEFQFKDTMVALTNLFSSLEVVEDFKLQPSTVRNEVGERVYSSLDTYEWWEEMQVNTIVFVVLFQTFHLTIFYHWIPLNFLHC
jgi:hypothetical protein